MCTKKMPGVRNVAISVRTTIVTSLKKLGRGSPQAFCNFFIIHNRKKNGRSK